MKKNKGINLHFHPVWFFSPVLRVAGVFVHFHNVILQKQYYTDLTIYESTKFWIFFRKLVQFLIFGGQDVMSRDSLLVRFLFLYNIISTCAQMVNYYKIMNIQERWV